MRSGIGRRGERRSRATGAAPSGPELSGTNLERAGDHNQRVTLHAIRVNGPVTRAELAKMTGLTAASITNITNRLLRDRHILSAGQLRGSRGQPATRLVINPDSCFSVGLNIDRDHITLVVLDFVGKVRARASREVAFAKPATVRSFVQRCMGQMLARARIPRSRLVGVGIAFPDDLTRTRLPQQPDDYSEWASVRVDDLIRDVLGIPVFVENDAAAAAVGEMQFGSGHRYRSFFYLLITAALGGGLVVDGSYYRGANGRSGEIGWLLARNAAGDVQQLQKIVSLSALYARLAASGLRVEAPAQLEQLDASAAPIIDAWIAEASDALADACAAINCLINPEAILIGGRLPAPLVDQLAASLNARLAATLGQVPAVAAVARAAMADDAPAVGAAILPFSDRFLPTRNAVLKTG
jgi:predicted NBD/HSP70 family sugar kinase